MSACLLDCLSRYISDNCGCREFHMIGNSCQTKDLPLNIKYAENLDLYKQNTDKENLIHLFVKMNSEFITPAIWAKMLLCVQHVTPYCLYCHSPCNI